jgi:hypothetical protein
MIQKSFDAVEKGDIDALVAHGVMESKTLEYKRELPGKGDRDSKEFLADVASFGNASGGDIIYGMNPAVDAQRKKTGAADKVVPIQKVTADDAKLRLEQTIRNGIDPRLRLQIKEVRGWGSDEQGFVILVRIPKSFASPHMVTFKNTSRFYSRHSSGKYQLDVQEIRSAFLATDSQAERIRRFRMERLAAIGADETPVLLVSPRRFVLHMIPIPGFLTSERLDLSGGLKAFGPFLPIKRHSCNDRHNLDGFLVYATSEDNNTRSRGYAQIYASGVIEAVSADIVYEEQGVWYFGSHAYERHLKDAVDMYLNVYRNLGVLPPVHISLALVGCKGILFDNETNLHYGGGEPIDRDPAIMPDVMIESLSPNTGKEMRPIFDAVWNACGLPRSLNYDEDGNWRAH